eukprot:COSAG04_NODE_2290_length_4380_cov_2.919411_3_plen_67_part_00
MLQECLTLTTWLSTVGKVSGSLPLGLTRPNSTLAAAFPPSSDSATSADQRDDACEDQCERFAHVQA